MQVVKISLLVLDPVQHVKQEATVPLKAGKASCTQHFQLHTWCFKEDGALKIQSTRQRIDQAREQEAR